MKDTKRETRMPTAKDWHGYTKCPRCGQKVPKDHRWEPRPHTKRLKGTSLPTDCK